MKNILLFYFIFITIVFAIAEDYQKIKFDDLIPLSYSEEKEFASINWDELEEDDEKMINKIQSILDNAPSDEKWNGIKIDIKGYLSPLDYSKDGIYEFFLVPYFGACIHSPPPPANQIIYVKPDKPVPTYYFSDIVRVKGTLSVTKNKKDIGVSGYTLKMDSITTDY
jgi:hypothetical protein